MHYLRISLIVDSEEDLEIVREALTTDLELSLDESCKVVNITHDRDLAKAFVVERSAGMHEVLTPVVSSLPVDVAAVLQQYSFTLPKAKKGEPDWRVPKNQLWGQIQGLHTLRGRIVLTNGIMAFLVREDGMWYSVHWNHFIADDLDALPDDLPRPYKESKEDKKTELLFAGF
jgi:hypothetical protein